MAKNPRQLTRTSSKRITTEDLSGAQFYQLHKFLFAGQYRALTNDARVLYALLRDRFSLSMENDWVNDRGEVYLIYSRENMSEMLGCSENTVRKAMNQLKLSGLLEEERMGVNKPNRIYLSAQTQSGRGPSKFAGQDPQNLRPNKTEYNKTEKDINNTSNYHSTALFLNEYENTKENIEEYLQYFYHAYEEYRGEEHPRLKLDQLKNVYDVINQAIYDYDEAIYGAIDDFFTTVKSNDFNINHFVHHEIIIRLCERNK